MTNSRYIVKQLRSMIGFSWTKPAAQLIEDLEKKGALNKIEIRQLRKMLEKFEARSKDYLTIYQLLSKHHPPTQEGLTNDR
jgi:hypothetical protein